jgi:DHA1 family bicyclomycin/chloramphenicol resistance-like MFS transporter
MSGVRTPKAAGEPVRERQHGAPAGADGGQVRPGAVGRTRMIVILGALVALGPLTMDIYLPALPRISAELHVSSSAAQLTLTGTLAGIVVHMLASALCAGAPNIVVLGIARCVQGFGAAD